MDRVEFAQKLAGSVDAFDILYEDISDDGDGVLRLTGLGEELADFIEQEIDRAREEGRKEGYEQGGKEGYEEGKREGYEEGGKEGYEEGRKEGYEEGAKEAANDVASRF